MGQKPLTDAQLAEAAAGRYLMTTFGPGFTAGLLLLERE